MANMIKGEEQKFAINITAAGFSMDADNFDVTISSPRNSVTGSKTGAVADTSIQYKVVSDDGAVTISREPDTMENGETVTGEWFVVVDTQYLNVGDLTVTTTAYIQDTAANDGVRKSLSRASLGPLKN